MPPILWVLTGIASVLGYKFVCDKDQKEKKELRDQIRKQNDDIINLKDEINRNKKLNQEAIKLINDHYETDEKY